MEESPVRPVHRYTVYAKPFTTRPCKSQSTPHGSGPCPPVSHLRDKVGPHVLQL